MKKILLIFLVLVLVMSTITIAADSVYKSQIKDINFLKNDKLYQYKYYSVVIFGGSLKQDFKGDKKIKIDWGNGKTEEKTVQFSNFEFGHLYREKGKYNIILNINNREIEKEIEIKEVPIEFEDKNLSKNLYKELKEISSKENFKLEIEGLIYPSQAKYLKNLNTIADNLGNNGITSLKGIEHFTNLKKLKINNNNITDIKPLKKLNKLEVLNIRNNKITDISPIKSLKSLKKIDLADNQIKEIKDNKILKDLKNINLENNNLKEINFSNDSFKKLENLNLMNNSIKYIDFSNSDFSNLKIIGLYNNNLKEINLSESNFENLEILELHKNDLETIDTEGSNFNKLKKLNISENNNLSDIYFIKNFKNLKELMADNINASTIEPLLSLKKLEKVFFISPSFDKEKAKNKKQRKELINRGIDIVI